MNSRYVLLFFVVQLLTPIRRTKEERQLIDNQHFWLSLFVFDDVLSPFVPICPHLPTKLHICGKISFNNLAAKGQKSAFAAELRLTILPQRV